MKLLELRNVWKTYFMGTSQVHALRGASLSVKEGEFLAIQGPSGSGKSTMMSLIGCLDLPTKGSIMLVGGIGIMNTMYTAVLERTREIGIMKAIGARNEDILAIFLIESGLLGMTGGSLGILLGAALSKGVEFAAAQMWGPNLLQASIPWYLIAGALLFSFLAGTISGVLPARQASHMKPSDALQYE